MKLFFATLAATLSFTQIPAAFAADTAAPTDAKAKHEPSPTMKADADAINTACADDAKTAGCGDEKVGTGLMKCLWAYKREHKAAFKFSDSCKGAMKQAHSDRKAGK